MNTKSDDNNINVDANRGSSELETPMPQLGASRSKGINKKGLAFMALLFLTIAGLVVYFYTSRITTKSVEKKPTNPEVLKIPERVRAEPKPPTQPAAIALSNPEQVNKLNGPVAGNQPQQIPLELKRALQGGSVFTSENEQTNDPTRKEGTAASPSISNLSSDQKLAETQDTVARRRAREGGSVSDFLGGVMRPQNQNNQNNPIGTGSSPQSSLFSPGNNLLGGNTQASGSNNSSRLGSANSGLQNAPNQGVGSQNALLQGLGALTQQGNIGGGLAQLAGGANSAGNDDPTATEFAIKSARLIPHSPDTYLLQGTSFRCVMETRLISGIDGQTMCAVVENIYSVNATKILVPKGSRMIGEYKKSLGSPERTGIIWNRLITPTGIDVNISSPATDLLGASAVPGYIDNHWVEKLSAAFLISVASDIFKYGVITRGPKVAKTIVDARTGNVTIVEEPFESDLVNNSSKAAAQVLAKSLTREPTITVPQGTLINIVTKRDLDFSSIY
jgi:type IV secretory pathway VirB10-like protein